MKPPRQRPTTADRTMLFLAINFAFFLCQKTQAQPFSLPTNGLNAVAIENTSSETQHLWVSVPVDHNTDFEERSLEIPAGETLNYTFQEELRFPWVQIKSYDQAFVKITAYNSKTKTRVVEGRSESLISSPFAARIKGVLTLVNLSPIAQDGIILRSSPRKKKGSSVLNQSLDLPKFGSTQVALSVEWGDLLQINAKYPIAASFQSNDSTVFMVLRPDKSKTEFQTQSTGSYFEMIDDSHDQSFIFYSEDPQIILQARRQVLYPEERKILFATIQKGHDNTNRDLSSNLKTPWSWSVDKVSGFGFFGSIECDGSPALVEDNLIPWIESGKGICFWGYRILRELNPTEVETGYSP